MISSRAKELLEAFKWEEAEKELSEIQQSGITESTLLLQAHAIGQVPLMSRLEISFKTSTKDKDLKRLLNAASYVRKALDLAIEKKASIRRIAQTYALVMKDVVFESPQSFIQDIKLIAKTLDDDASLSIFYCLLLAQLSLDKDKNEVKECFFTASRLAKENPTCRYIYTKQVSQILKLKSNCMDFIEPGWNNFPLLKSFVTFEKVRNEKGNIKDLIIKIQKDLKNAVGEEPIFVDELAFRIDLAREAVNCQLLPVSDEILSDDHKEKMDQRYLGFYRILEVERVIQVLNQQNKEQGMNTLLASTSRLLRVMDEMLGKKLFDVATECGIQIWNALLPMLNDANRQVLLSTLKDVAKAMDSLPAPPSELVFLLHHELSKSFESLDLMSLATTHALEAQTKSKDYGLYEDSKMVVERLEAKLERYGATNITQALLYVDRSNAGNPDEALFCITKAMNLLIPDYHYQSTPLFTINYDATCTPEDPKLTSLVLIEIIRACKRIGSKPFSGKLDLWGIAFDAAQLYLLLVPLPKEAFGIKLNIEARMAIGIAQSSVLEELNDTNMTAVESIVSGFLAAAKIARPVDKDASFNCLASIWNLYVKLHSFKSEKINATWNTVLEQVYNQLVEYKMQNSTLFVNISFAYMTVLLDGYKKPTPELARKGAKAPVDPGPSPILKTVEDICKTAFACKEIDHNAIFLLSSAWGRLVEIKGLPVTEADEKLLKSLCSLEQPVKEETWKNSLTTLKTFPEIPTVFKIELFGRLATQAIQLEKYTVAYACAKDALVKLEALMKIKKESKDWMGAVLLSTSQVYAVLLHQDKPCSKEELYLETMRLISLCIEISSKSNILVNCFRLLWNISQDYLTKRQTIFYKPFLEILKKLNFHPTIKSLNEWELADQQKLRNLYLVMIDISRDQNNTEQALKLCDWGYKMLPVQLHDFIWFRKAYILTVLGKGSSIVPLKDPNVETQAKMWAHLASTLEPLKKLDAYKTALTLLETKKSSHLPLYREIILEICEWAYSVDRLDIVREMMSKTNEAPIHDMLLLGEELIRLELGQEQVFGLCIERLKNSLETLLKSFKKEDIEPAKPDKKKKEEPVIIKIDVPTMDKWFSYSWPLVIKQLYMKSTSTEYINHSNVKNPYIYLSYLYRLLQYVLSKGMTDESFLILNFMELITESCPEKDSVSAIRMYFAYCLKQAGKSFKSKYKEALIPLERVAPVPSHLPLKHHKLFPLGDHQSLLFLRGECHYYFGDLTEATQALNQAARLSEYQKDDETFFKSITCLSFIRAHYGQYDDAYKLSQRVLSQCGDISTQIRAILPLTVAKIVVSRKEPHLLDVMNQAESEMDKLYDKLDQVDFHTFNLLQTKLALAFYRDKKQDTPEKRLELLSKLRFVTKQVYSREKEALVVFDYIDNVKKLGYKKSHQKEIRQILLDFEDFEDYSDEVQSRILIELALIEILNDYYPTIVQEKVYANVVEEYLDELDYEIRKERGLLPVPSVHVLNVNVFEKLKEMTIPDSLKPLYNFCTGMKLYLEKSEEVVLMTKTLASALDHQLNHCDFFLAKITSEVLFRLAREGDHQAAFKYLAILQGCAPSQYLKESSKSLTLETLSLKYRGFFITEESLWLGDKLEQMNETFDHMSVYSKLQFTMDIPDHFKVLILQHSSDLSELYVGLISKRALSKKSDVLSLDYELATVQVNVDQLKDLQEVLSKGKWQPEVLLEYIRILDTFKKDPPLEEPVAQAPPTLKKQPTAKEIKEVVKPEDPHIVLLLDELFETLPLDGVIGNYLTRVETVSRDFTISTLLQRLAHRVVKEAPPEPKKKDKHAVEEKVDGTCYMLASRNTWFLDSVNQSIGQVPPQSLKFQGQLNNDDVFGALVKPTVFYIGQDFWKERLQELGAVNYKGSCVFLEYYPSHSVNGIESSFIKPIAAHFTLCGAASIVMPLFKLPEPLIQQILPKLLDEPRLGMSYKNLIHQLPVMACYGLPNHFTK